MTPTVCVSRCWEGVHQHSHTGCLVHRHWAADVATPLTVNWTVGTGVPGKAAANGVTRAVNVTGWFMTHVMG